MEDRLWEKYKFGEVFKVNDNNTKAASIRNPFYEPQGADFPMAAIEGVKKLQSRGAMFCVCDIALTVYSGMVAQSIKQKPEDVKKDWVSGFSQVSRYSVRSVAVGAHKKTDAVTVMRRIVIKLFRRALRSPDLNLIY